jgi:hypothetical protein
MTLQELIYELEETASRVGEDVEVFVADKYSAKFNLCGVRQAGLDNPVFILIGGYDGSAPEEIYGQKD